MCVCMCDVYVCAMCVCVCDVYVCVCVCAHLLIVIEVN